MKQIFIIIFTILLAFSANAKSLVFVLADGTQVFYLIEAAKYPVMTWDDGYVTVNAKQYAFSEISRFYISNTDDPSGIDGMQVADRTFDGETLMVNSTSELAVYRVDGKQVHVKTAVKDGVTAVMLSSLRRGTYLVRVGDSSFKIQKK